MRSRILARLIFTEGGCWFWAGAQHPQGYGLIKRKDGVQLRVHRVVYELVHGAIPAGAFVCHRCDEPQCVRPGHLFLGTHDDNMADMVSKGRAARLRGAHNGGARLQPAEVVAIRDSDDHRRNIAAQYGISTSAVGLIKRRGRWTHL